MQLAQSRMRQLGRQFRLTRKNDLQQLGLRRFKIRKQADRFQYRGIKVLRFVDNYNKTSSSSCFLDEATIELLVHLHEVFALALDAHFRQQEAHELARTALCLK